VYEDRWWTTILRVLVAFALVQAAVFGVLQLAVPELALAR
jgi:hypothetical protein